MSQQFKLKVIQFWVTRWDKHQKGKHVIPSANTTTSQIDVDTLVSIASIKVLMGLNFDNFGIL